MVTIFAVILVLALVFYSTSPQTRDELIRRAVAGIKQVRHEATRTRPECEQFREALRSRTRWAVVTPALVALNVAVFAFMVSAPGPVGDAETLLDWGGNFWLRTRNGEWWRLAASMFVHAGIFQLLVNVAGFAQIGLILERLVGRLIVAAVFLTAGVFASLVNLTTHPMAMSFGASGAVFGLYGLLLASSIWGIRHRSNVTIPLTIAKTLAPGAGVFILYNLANDSLGGSAELTGFLVGMVCGAVLTRGVSERKPAARRLAHVAATSVVMAVLSAIPLRGVTDVKPELERTVATEARTADAYRKASDRFRNGKMSAEALARLIDQAVMPELQATDERLKALTGVPQQHQSLVTDAEEYVRLRSESWRLRAEWLRKAGKLPRRGAEAAQHRANNRTIAQAEETERAALELLKNIQPTAEK